MKQDADYDKFIALKQDTEFDYNLLSLFWAWVE